MLSRFPKLVISISIICLTLLFVFKYISEVDNKTMTVSFLDVGQGDAVLISAPNGNKLLYDGGPLGGNISNAIKSDLPLLLRHIDVYVASHPDADHIGGFMEMLQHTKPKFYVDNHTVNPSQVFISIEKILNDNEIKRYSAKDGGVINLGKGVFAQVISLSNEPLSGDRNDSSIALIVSYGNSRVLLTGDMEEKVENELVKRYGKELNVSILKAGHHGAKTSTGLQLLKATSPDYVVISASKNNKYGHPHKATLSRISGVGAKILETSKSGTIKFECNTNNCIHVTN